VRSAVSYKKHKNYSVDRHGASSGHLAGFVYVVDPLGIECRWDVHERVVEEVQKGRRENHETGIFTPQ